MKQRTFFKRGSVVSVSGQREGKPHFRITQKCTLFRVGTKGFLIP